MIRARSPFALRPPGHARRRPRSWAPGLSGCAGFKTPEFFNFAQKKKENPRIAPGQRIPVLPSSEDLKPAAALKGVDFEIPAPEAMTDWPLPGGNPAQAVGHVAAGAEASRSPGAIASVRATPVSPTPWRRPVVAEGRLFVMDGRAGVTALDAATGRDVWHVDLSNRRGSDTQAFGGGVAYSDGLVFVTSGYRFVAALDAKDRQDGVEGRHLFARARRAERRRAARSTLSTCSTSFSPTTPRRARRAGPTSRSKSRPGC